jgi:hypothetical protein
MTEETEADAGWSWMMVEIFGHRQFACRMRTEEVAGVKMLRLDVPVEGNPAKGWKTQLYAPSAVFSLTPTDEASVMAANKPYERGRYLHLEDYKPLPAAAPTGENATVEEEMASLLSGVMSAETPVTPEGANVVAPSSLEELDAILNKPEDTSIIAVNEDGSVTRAAEPEDDGIPF